MGEVDVREAGNVDEGKRTLVGGLCCSVVYQNCDCEELRKLQCFPLKM